MDLQVGYEGGGGSVNVQGEEQKKLDVVTNDVLKRALAFTGKVQDRTSFCMQCFSRYHREMYLNADMWLVGG